MSEDWELLYHSNCDRMERLEKQLSEKEAEIERLKGLSQRIGSGWALVNAEELEHKIKSLEAEIKRQQEWMNDCADCKKRKALEAEIAELKERVKAGNDCIDVELSKKSSLEQKLEKAKLSMTKCANPEEHLIVLKEIGESDERLA